MSVLFDVSNFILFLFQLCLTTSWQVFYYILIFKRKVYNCVRYLVRSLGGGIGIRVRLKI